jgi:hypothetical protein
VASVVVDLDGFGRGIDVRLEPGADEVLVMEQLRALLAAYGLRQDRQPRMSLGRPSRRVSDLGVDVSVTPVEGGARIEVATGLVRSFRIVSSDPIAVTQGLADAWCQVIARMPIEIVTVEVSEDGRLTVLAHDGANELTGVSRRGDTWVDALTEAVGDVLGQSGSADLNLAAS